MDNLTPQEQQPQPMEVASDPKPGLLSTTRGKVIVIVGAIVGFLLVAGIAAAIVFTFFLTEDPAANVTPTPVATSTTTTVTPGVPEAAPVIVEPAEVPLTDLFTFRDIFVPLIEPASSDGSSTDATTTDTTRRSTLYLLDTTVEDGTDIAVLSYNGTQYRLAEGEGIPGTPWEVLTIGPTSVVMLYGDTQISISIGQGVVDGTTGPK